MALGSYIRGGAAAAKKGISTVGSYMLKPVDKIIAKNKAVDEARRKRDQELMRQNFGSPERYEAQRRETDEIIKKRLEEKQKGTPKSSYVKKR